MLIGKVRLRNRLSALKRRSEFAGLLKLAFDRVHMLVSAAKRRHNRPE